MTLGIRLFIYPVRDIGPTKTLFSKLLGIEPYFDQAYYVGFKVGDQEIGLDPNGHNQGMTGPVGYWQVDDITISLQLLLDAGAQAQQQVKDVGGGKLIASVQDASSNIIGLVQLPWRSPNWPDLSFKPDGLARTLGRQEAKLVRDGSSLTVKRDNREIQSPGRSRRSGV